MQITKQMIVEIGRRHTIYLNQESIQINDSNLDFHIAFATDIENKKWVMRIPKNVTAFERTLKEKNILDFLHPLLTVKIPKWEIYSNDLIAYEQMTDHPLSEEKMTKKMQANTEKTLAKVLVSLHQVPSATVQPIAEVRQIMKERMNIVKREFGVGEELWDRWQAWLSNDELWPEKTGIIHGNLHPNNILIDKKGNVTGVSDWAASKTGDMSKDFCGYYRLFGEESLDSLMAAYIKAGGYHWPKMKEHIIELNATQGLDVAEYAMEIDSDEYKQMARQILGFYR